MNETREKAQIIIVAADWSWLILKESIVIDRRKAARKTRRERKRNHWPFCVSFAAICIWTRPLAAWDKGAKKMSKINILCMQKQNLWRQWDRADTRLSALRCDVYFVSSMHFISLSLSLVRGFRARSSPRRMTVRAYWIRICRLCVHKRYFPLSSSLFV